MTAANFVLNQSCHPSSYFKLAYLPSCWQLDGLYTPSLILPLDLRLGAAAPLGIIPRILGDKTAFQENYKNTKKKYTTFHSLGAPTSDKIASKTHMVAPRMDFGRWSYISRLSWTVLASIWGGLGADFAPLGIHLGSNLASKIAPEPP